MFSNILEYHEVPLRNALGNLFMNRQQHITQSAMLGIICLSIIWIQINPCKINVQLQTSISSV